MELSDFRKYIAEFVGTCVLVLFGCGSAVAANALYTVQGLSVPLAFTTLTISVAFGLCIVAMAYSIGNVSGCHINPAVSLGCFVAGRMTVKDLIGYIAAQFLGGFAGAFLLSIILGSKAALGQNGYGSASALGIDAVTAIIVEIVLTFVFVMVILCVTSKPKYGSVAGLVIGLTLTLIHIFGIPFTGTSVNPARSFGPAVLVGGDALKQLPVFIIAPLVGAILAALFYTFVLSGPDADAEETNDEAADDETDEADDETDDGAAEEEEDEGELKPFENDDSDNEDIARVKGNYDAAEDEDVARVKGNYDAAEEMMIENAPEPVAEAEAEAIEEADANAIVEN